jgi:hypothetical protein
MDAGLLQRLQQLVTPLYQDLDGASRLDQVNRVSGIARRMYQPPDQPTRQQFELLLLFQGLGSWLERVGSLSRVMLAAGPSLAEQDLRQVARSLQRLGSPSTDAERALAAARLIDQAGLRGLAERIASARREGVTVEQIAENPSSLQRPEWLDPAAREWIERRAAKRRQFCQSLLAEMAGEE